MTDGVRRMRVDKYIPGRMFGFLIAETGPQVFFHLRAFHPGAAPATPFTCPNCKTRPCDWLGTAPPPIIGETVDATLESDPVRPESLRAATVTRIVVPEPVLGTVETFDGPRGFGFIRGSDQRSYYLHRSEVVEGRIPIVGQQVMFYTAARVDKARACHIRICQLRPS